MAKHNEEIKNIIESSSGITCTRRWPHAPCVCSSPQARLLDTLSCQCTHHAIRHLTMSTHTHLSHFLVLHSVKGTFPDGQHNSYGTCGILGSWKSPNNKWKPTEEHRKEKKEEIANHILCWKSKLTCSIYECCCGGLKSKTVQTVVREDNAARRGQPHHFYLA